MKFSLPLFASLLFAVATHASDVYDDQDDRILRMFGGGGGGMRGGPGGGRPPFGPPPEPTVELDCTGAVQTCTPRRPGTTAAADSGIRVCLQHPEDSNKTKTMCMEDTDNLVMVFSEADTCGCCGGECPSPCNGPSCGCTGTNRDGVEYDGYTMDMTRRGWFGNEVSITTCVPAEATVDAQLRGASCAEECDE